MQSALQIEMAPVKLLKLDPKNLRQIVDPDAMTILMESVKTIGCHTPLLVRPDYVIVDGSRRYMAALQAGLAELPVIRSERSEDEIKRIQFSSDFHKEHLSGYERSVALCDLAEQHPEWTQRQIGDFVKITDAAVCRYLSMRSVSEDWREAFRADVVGLSDVVAASKLPTEAQAGLLALKKSGATRDELQTVARKIRAPKSIEAAPKAKKLRCDLPGGVCVVVSGDEISLDDGVEALSKAMSAMKKAIHDGVSARTFAAFMKDKAKN